MKNTANKTLSSEGFKLSIDEARRTITFRFIGDGLSRECADQLLKAVESLDDLGAYKQVWDYRYFTSILEPQDVERIAERWLRIRRPDDKRILTAVIAHDPLTPARAKAYAGLFPGLDIHSFRDLRQALDWLDRA